LDERETQIKFSHEFLYGDPGELLGVTWDWRTAAEHPVDTILEKGLPLGRISAVVGESDSGKTFIALLLGLSIALGRPLIPGLKPKGRNNVLLGLAEDSVVAVARRLRNLAEAYEIAPNEIDGLLGSSLRLLCDLPRPPCCHNGRGIAPDERNMRFFEELMTEPYPPDLIILDPFALWAPVENENSSGQISGILEFLKSLCRKHNVALTLVHHVSKMRGSELHQSAARGSSAFSASCRFMIGIRRIDRPSFECPPGSYLELQIVKNNDGPRSTPIVMSRNPKGVPIPVEKPKVPDIQSLIVDAVREFPKLTVRELYSRKEGESAREFIFRALGSKITQNELKLTLESCLRLGVLEEVRDGRRVEVCLPSTMRENVAKMDPIHEAQKTQSESQDG